MLLPITNLVPADHTYKKILSLLNFKHLSTDLRKKEGNSHYKGFGIEMLFKCLFLQVFEDLSDRELERFLQENNAAKYFCGLELVDKTPKYSLFTKVRQRIGPHELSKIFVHIRKTLQNQGYMNEVFSFVDASHLVSKNNLWKERDKAIKEKYDKLNNDVLPKVARDNQARIGCKGKNHFWYGFKKHTSVDMQTGLINKVAITPANVTDSSGLKHVCPGRGAVFADKGYCGKKSDQIIKRKGCENATIKKNNMKDKDRDLDRWRTKMRAPYESIFSKTNHRVRYVGVAKNQFFAFMEAMCLNTKRLIVLEAPALELV